MIDAVVLSRLQFAITALYHFLFVPLTLGLVIILAIMETIYVLTGKDIWKKMTQFWGMLFGINFAMGVATGMTMEFQFGTNWSYYAHYVGDIFGVPLAIEGMVAFFFEATFAGIFFFGWDRMSRKAHLVCTWILAAGTSLSAYWILVANGWMQDPVGAYFNTDTMRMELQHLYRIMLSSTAQCKFVHTLNAGYVTGALFVTAISCYYLLRGKHLELARRSLWVSTPFGLYAVISVIILGDESGYTVGHGQKMKLASIEAAWHTEEPPAGLTLVGWPSVAEKKTKWAIRIPYLMGLITTRSLDTPVLGINDLVKRGKSRIKKGMLAYGALQELKKDRDNETARQTFRTNEKYLGYGLLLKRRAPNVVDATHAQIKAAANDLVPDVPAIFWSFRIMVGCGFAMLAFFMLAWYWMHKSRLEEKRWLLYVAPLVLPMPWLASSCGWILAEHGRQPWAIDKILPTYYGASPLPASFVWFTLIGFIVFYSTLLVVDLYLMARCIRMGPDEDRPLRLK